MHIFTGQSKQLVSSSNGTENLGVEEYFDLMYIFCNFLKLSEIPD